MCCYIKATSSAVEIFKLSLDLLNIKCNCTALFLDKCIGYLLMFQNIISKKSIWMTIVKYKSEFSHQSELSELPRESPDKDLLGKLYEV